MKPERRSGGIVLNGPEREVFKAVFWNYMKEGRQPGLGLDDACLLKVLDMGYDAALVAANDLEKLGLVDIREDEDRKDTYICLTRFGYDFGTDKPERWTAFLDAVFQYSYGKKKSRWRRKVRAIAMAKELGIDPPRAVDVAIHLCDRELARIYSISPGSKDAKFELTAAGVKEWEARAFAGKEEAYAKNAEKGPNSVNGPDAGRPSFWTRHLTAVIWLASVATVSACALAYYIFFFDK